MEEVFLRILGRDEAEAAIGDDLLDGSGGHDDPPGTSRTPIADRTARSKRVDHAEPSQRGNGLESSPDVRSEGPLVRPRPRPGRRRPPGAGACSDGPGRPLRWLSRP